MRSFSHIVDFSAIGIVIFWERDLLQLWSPRHHHRRPCDSSHHSAAADSTTGAGLYSTPTDPLKCVYKDQVVLCSVNNAKRIIFAYTKETEALLVETDDPSTAQQALRICMLHFTKKKKPDNTIRRNGRHVRVCQACQVCVTLVTNARN